jgi:hypothetical protein
MKLACCTDNKTVTIRYTYEEYKHDYDDRNFDDAVKPDAAPIKVCEQKFPFSIYRYIGA